MSATLTPWVYHANPGHELTEHWMGATAAAVAGIVSGANQKVKPLVLGGGFTVTEVPPGSGNWTLGLGGPGGPYVLKAGDTMTGALRIPDGTFADPSLKVGAAGEYGLWKTAVAAGTGGVAALGFTAKDSVFAGNFTPSMHSANFGSIELGSKGSSIFSALANVNNIWMTSGCSLDSTGQFVYVNSVNQPAWAMSLSVASDVFAVRRAAAGANGALMSVFPAPLIIDSSLRTNVNSYALHNNALVISADADTYYSMYINGVGRRFYTQCYSTGSAVLHVAEQAGWYMGFYTAGAERWRIPADATAIQFPPSNVPSANANALDDYEEGTFNVTSGTSGITLTINATGQYVKIGSYVFTFSYFRIGNSSGAGATAIQINSLPFSCTSSNYGWANTYYGIQAVGQMAHCFVNAGGNYILFYTVGTMVNGGNYDVMVGTSYKTAT